ncbi:protoporphyrinogen oxidase [Rosettibacter firmus]|uniref:protoporphyrinogen oxidase n=1 Tax=Rosettibacter firmus TaxID=3111522 RepID=UPI00336BFFC0
MSKKIVILGAGISGLTSAYWLFKKGFDIKILEAASKSGGSMQTEIIDNFLIDYGPNSGLETTPLIRQIVEEVGLVDEFVYANESSKNRYILKNNELHALPMNPLLFIKTKLFSTKAKLRLLAEPFVGKSVDGYYQSVAEFVRRRLGGEFLDYAIDPFVSGVFAGDPEKLSVKSAFPKLYRLEEVYGGLIKGMIKGAKERKQRAEQSKQSAKMFSFINGMQSFPQAIAKKLEQNILYECIVKKVKKVDDKWEITYEKSGQLNKIYSDIVFSTVPAYVASKIFDELDSELSNHLNEIYYPPVMVLYLGFKKESVQTPLDGFGFLIPSKEQKHFLGAIWSSAIFPNRCDEDKAAFTLFIGGARSPHLFDIEKEKLIDIVLKEFKEIMKIKSDPLILKDKFWEKAIPQYNLGYIEHELYFEKFESNNPGIFLSGNYRGGISVGDCVKNSEIRTQNIDN